MSSAHCCCGHGHTLGNMAVYRPRQGTSAAKFRYGMGRLRRGSPCGMAKTSLALSNLRAAVIVIVVAFHSSLAYLASAPTLHTGFDQAPYKWQAFPIVNTHHWLGFDIFCAWQDVSLMSLMFLLSGLFSFHQPDPEGCGKICRGPLVAHRPALRIGGGFPQSPFLLSGIFHPHRQSERRRILERVARAAVWPAGPEWFLCNCWHSTCWPRRYTRSGPALLGISAGWENGRARNRADFSRSWSQRRR